MSLAALALWSALSGAVPPTVGETLPPGLYPTGVLLAAYYAIDRRALRLEEAELAKRPVWLFAPLAIDEKSLFSITILLRSAGVHLLPWQNLGSAPFLYATEDPSRPPQSLHGLRVTILTLAHLDAVEAAAIMNRIVSEQETDLGEGEPPSRFIAEPRTQRLVVRYTSEERLSSYRQILRLVDIHAESDSRVGHRALRLWKARSRHVAGLGKDLEKAWKKESQAPLNIVPNVETNTLMLSIPRQSWPQVKELLEKLDRPRM